MVVLAAGPPDRAVDRRRHPGALAGRHRPGDLVDPAGLPPARRRHHVRRPRRAGDGLPRRPRHPADLRPDAGRPVPRAGLRPRPGPVLGDGLPPARHRRAAVRAVRPDQVETDTFLRTLGWRRVAEAGVALLPPETRAHLPGVRRRVNAWIADHGAAPTRPARRAWSTRVLGLRNGDYTIEPWQSGRLARLAQGDGLGPARQHGDGDRPRAAPGQRADPGAGGPALPRVPVRPQPPDRRRRRGRHGASFDADRATAPVAPGRAAAARPSATRLGAGARGRWPGRSTGCRRCWAATAPASAPTPG